MFVGNAPNNAKTKVIKTRNLKHTSKACLFLQNGTKNSSVFDVGLHSPVPFLSISEAAVNSKVSDFFTIADSMTRPSAHASDSTRVTKSTILFYSEGKANIIRPFSTMI